MPMSFNKKSGFDKGKEERNTSASVSTEKAELPNLYSTATLGLILNPDSLRRNARVNPIFQSFRSSWKQRSMSQITPFDLDDFGAPKASPAPTLVSMKILW